MDCPLTQLVPTIGASRIMDLTLLLLLFFQEIKQSSADYYCARQDRTIRVKEGGSTTIPCTFTYPEHVERSALEILWHDTEYGDCSNPTSIYNSNMNTAHDKYQGRISKMKNPIRNRTESIKIQRLNRTDGPVICCQVNIQNAEHTLSYFPSYGTHLLFSDQVWVDQLEAVPASLGEDVTIPCHINYTAGFIKKNLQQVIWTKGEKCLIADTTFTFQAKHGWSTLGYSNFSVVDFPNDVSLRIRNVQKEDTMIFCCSVKINETTFSAKHGTELVIKGQPNFRVPASSPFSRSSIRANEPPNKQTTGTTLSWHDAFLNLPSGIYSSCPGNLQHPYRLCLLELQYAKLNFLSLLSLDHSSFPLLSSSFPSSFFLLSLPSFFSFSDIVF
ncbi:sialic acid-binding Ig-like lectin 14 [Pelobates cultripes]|uniref:Sialic acid-binding Ig-like lectin 14 n=1 Tax=Pelobates cultripes TaxID=61616 RepID=A0AAD1VXK2_PELCU|nr:sialic acid-binding Ig-like lectin 14 [Pelobates cultripes]